MEESILNRILSNKEKEELLLDLFGLKVMDGVIFDQSGFKFNGFSFDFKCDFSTLRGFFDYVRAEAIQKGIQKNQSDIKRILGI